MPAIQTHFKDDHENWVIVQNVDPSNPGLKKFGPLKHHTDKGDSHHEHAPNGAVSFTDSSGRRAFFCAPNSYLGNHSEKFGCFIKYSIHIEGASKKDIVDTATDIQLFGGGLRLVCDVPPQQKPTRGSQQAYP